MNYFNFHGKKGIISAFFLKYYYLIISVLDKAFRFYFEIINLMTSLFWMASVSFYLFINSCDFFLKYF